MIQMPPAHGALYITMKDYVILPNSAGMLQCILCFASRFYINSVMVS